MKTHDAHMTLIKKKISISSHGDRQLSCELSFFFICSLVKTTRRILLIKVMFDE
jgi:hypothetical protein